MATVQTVPIAADEEWLVYCPYCPFLLPLLPLGLLPPLPLVYWSTAPSNPEGPHDETQNVTACLLRKNVC